MRLFLERLEPQSPGVLGDGFIQFALLLEGVAEKEMRFRIVWLVAQGLSVEAHCLLQLAFLGQQAAQDGDGPPIVPGHLRRVREECPSNNGVE